MPKKLKREAEIEYTAACVSCGALVPESQKFVSGGKNYCTSCAIISRREEPALHVPAGIVKWICYLVSFLSPFAGFALGLVFLSQKDQESRNFGRHCIIVMCISLSIILLFVIVSMILSALAIGGGNLGLNIGEGYY